MTRARARGSVTMSPGRAQLRRTRCFGDVPLDGADAAYRSLIDLLTSVDRDVDFRIANSVWQGGYPIRPELVARVRTSVDAEAGTVPFSDEATVAVIDDWVKANGKIPKSSRRSPRTRFSSSSTRSTSTGAGATASTRPRPRLRRSGLRRASARRSQPVCFVVDRPFVFVFREWFPGAILFMGRIATLPA